MARDNLWTRDQLLVAFRLYCQTPYGRLSRGNPEIIELARLIGRTPDAVAMKACNFASLDSSHLDRGIRSLQNCSRADRELWQDFQEDSESVAAEAEAAYEQFSAMSAASGEPSRLEESLPRDASLANERPSTLAHEAALLPAAPGGETEVERLTRVRRVQHFFRKAVLISYRGRCAISGLRVGSLLNASHIIPWTESVERRADPRNGIALNALYDRAFDRGLITFDESLSVVVSPALRADEPSPFHRVTLLEIAGRPLDTPARFSPDPQALAWHRKHVFRA